MRPHGPGNKTPLKFQCAHMHPVRNGLFWLVVAKKQNSPWYWKEVEHEMQDISFHLRPNSLFHIHCAIFHKFFLVLDMASGRIDESQFGKISAHPHTSLCIHTWGFFIQCIIIKMCLHKEIWGCAEIFLKMQKIHRCTSWSWVSSLALEFFWESLMLMLKIKFDREKVYYFTCNFVKFPFSRVNWRH